MHYHGDSDSIDLLLLEKKDASIDVAIFGLLVIPLLGLKEVLTGNKLVQCSCIKNFDVMSFVIIIEDLFLYLLLASSIRLVMV